MKLQFNNPKHLQVIKLKRQIQKELKLKQTRDRKIMIEAMEKQIVILLEEDELINEKIRDDVSDMK